MLLSGVRAYDVSEHNSPFLFRYHVLFGGENSSHLSVLAAARPEEAAVFIKAGSLASPQSPTGNDVLFLIRNSIYKKWNLLESFAADL